VDWSHETPILRKELLKLGKNDLRKACKFKGVRFTNRKKDTVSRLLSAVEDDRNESPPDPSLADLDEDGIYEPEDDELPICRRLQYTESKAHNENFSTAELEAVGLSWMLPSRSKHPPRASYMKRHSSKQSKSTNLRFQMTDNTTVSNSIPNDASGFSTSPYQLTFQRPDSDEQPIQTQSGETQMMQTQTQTPNPQTASAPIHLTPEARPNKQLTFGGTIISLTTPGHMSEESAGTPMVEQDTMAINHRMQHSASHTPSAIPLHAMDRNVNAGKKNAQTLRVLPKFSTAHTDFQSPAISETLEHELTKKIESYGTFEVMSSLVFGFAVSVAFSNINSEHFHIEEDEEESVFNDVAEVLFTVFIIVVLVCNAYTMIVLSLSYFHVHRYLADQEFIMAAIYLKIYANYRKFARKSFYVGLVSFMISIGIYLIPLSTKPVNTIALFLVLGAGLILIIYTLWMMTNPHRICDKDNAGHRKFLRLFQQKGGVHEKKH